MDHELVTSLLDGCDFRADFDSYPKAFCPRHQLIDKIRIKSLQRPLPAMQYGDLSARSCSNVSELEGDVPTSDKDDPSGQLLQFKEPFAGCYVLFSRNA